MKANPLIVEALRGLLDAVQAVGDSERLRFSGGREEAEFDAAISVAADAVRKLAEGEDHA